MKTQAFGTLPAIFLPFLLLACAAPLQVSAPTASSSSPLPADSKLEFPGRDDQFIVYYNRWPDNDEFYKRMGGRYKLIILNIDDLVPPKAIEGDPAKVRAYRTNRIKMLRDAGAMVFAYLSIGEENVEANGNDGYPGDKQGPCNSTRCCKNGYASYYIDNGQCKPVVHVVENSYASAPVNPGRPGWVIKMKQAAKELMALGCTGLFLDTLDTPATTEAFAWTIPGMMRLLKELNNITSNIIVNRGIVLLEKPEFADDYKKLSWAVMYEDFYTEWKGDEGVDLSAAEQNASLTYWTPKLAGKNVLVVDFANCKQLDENSEVVARQKAAVATVNMTATPKWPNYFADQNFKEVRYRFKCDK